VAEKPKPAPAQPTRPAPRPQPIRPEQFLWAFPQEPPPEEEATPLRCAPAVDSAGRIFLHVAGRVFALEETEGKAKVAWEYVTGKHAPGPVVVGPDDAVYLHSTDGYLHSIDGVSGKQNWPPAYVGEPLGYAAPVVDQQGNAWISAFDGGLIKVDAQGQVQKGKFFRTRQKFDSAAILVAGVIYAAAESGYVFAIQADGEQAASLWSHVGELGFTGWCVHSAPAMTDDGILVVAGYEDVLSGFSAGGTPLWRTPMPGQMLGSPVLDRYGHIYAGVSQFPRGLEPRGLLVCLDGNSHKTRWEYWAAGAVESTPVIGDDDVIYFGDNTGTIHAVDFHGNGLWTAQVGSPVRSAGTIVGPERLAFGLDNETLVVLRCSSGGLAPGGWPKIGRTLGQSGTR
jgi:outer membrane protein assembly factor BamB